MKELGLLSTCLLIALNVVAAPLSPDDIAQLRQVTQARMSPAGDQAAYLLQVPRRLYEDDAGPAYHELHVVDLEGNSRPFVTGDVDVTDLAWSADGTQLYFLAKRDAEADFNSLHSISLTGGEAGAVYTHVNGISRIYPSPDGKSLAFLAEDAPPARTKDLSEKGFSAVIYEESVQSVKVWLLDLESGVARALELPGSASELAWAADGSRFGVALAPSPLVDDSFVARDIHIVAAATGEVVGRAGAVGKLGQFALSPDGNRLAYIGSEDMHDPREGRLFVVAATGGERRELLPDYPGHVTHVDWADPSTLRWLAYRGVYTEYSTAAIDRPRDAGKAPSAGPITHAMHGLPGQKSVIGIADTPAHPRELFLLRQDAEPQRLTFSNPWLGDRELARQEVIRYAARDGLELEAMLIHPLRPAPERVPLVIVAHGGPESQYSNGWLNWYSAAGQVFAAHGFAVVYPNYRGSTGRGVAFSRLGQGRAAGAEFDDLVDAKRHLVSRGLVDSDRVGITGGSYGGYASMWAASALTDEFAAAVAFVGISNQLSMFGTSDIPYEMYNVHSRAWPWDNWQDMLQRSPVYHAGKTTTPLLILAGDKDPRVYPGQSLEMYRYVKLRTATPVRLVFYPGEGHGNRNSAAQYDYSLRLVRWMQHYLQGPGGAPPPYELNHADRLDDLQPVF